MCTNGSSWGRETPAKARRTGKPSPPRPEGAVVTETTRRSAASGPGWDLSGTDGRPNAEELLDHLREFADEGWELVSLSFNIDLVRHGPSHLLVFKRAGDVGNNGC
jgi:hypothetical protein